MLDQTQFASEPLETRIEQYCYYYWCTRWCVKWVWGIPIYYLCWKYCIVCY
ncbi:MAG: hypothetical protein U0350_29780 [Caldilineaceae bacterium]